MGTTKKLGVWLIVLGIALAMPAMASADQLTLGFTDVTNPVDVTNGGIGQSQFSVLVQSVGTNQVSFTFTNVGSNKSTIDGIYFDDSTGILSAPMTIVNTLTSFAQAGSPGNLPGGNGLTPPFITTSNFYSTANPPPPFNGVYNTVDGSDSVTIGFNITSGDSFSDIVSALLDGDLRIGLHGINFDSGPSQSFVDNPGVSPVPEPAGVVLLGLGAMGLGGYGWRRRR